MKTYNDLRHIALGLIRGDILCDWMNPEDEEEICTLSEIQQLILQTEDIGMFFEERKRANHSTHKGDLIFARFEKLTVDEALQVAELFTKYTNILKFYGEVIIPHE